MFIKMNNKTKTLLARVDLSVAFGSFLKQLEKDYPLLGPIKSCRPITEGYEDANFLFETSRNKYVLKIFAKTRSILNIKSYSKLLVGAQKAKVQSLQPIRGKNGYLGKIKQTRFVITEFFIGRNFRNSTPSLLDIRIITKELVKLNSLNFKFYESYDSWSNAHLVCEFKKNKNKLDQATVNYLDPTVKALNKLNTRGFSRSIIHGDLQPLHIFKNNQGRYCLIDYGCARNDYLVYELSTFLAWFCLLKKNWQRRKAIFSYVIDTYTKTHKLSKQEIDSLPLLIKAAYAAYYLKTKLLIGGGDRSKQTRDWFKQAEKMLGLVRSHSLS